MNIRPHPKGKNGVSPKVTTPMATATLIKGDSCGLVTNLPAWRTTVTSQHEHVEEPHDGNDAHGDQQQFDMLDTGSGDQRRLCEHIMRAILALSRPRLVVRLRYSILRQFSSRVDKVCRWRDKSRPAEPAGRLLELACSPSLRRPIPWPKMLFM
jgi:hypothetical protein